MVSNSPANHSPRAELISGHGSHAVGIAADRCFLLCVGCRSAGSCGRWWSARSTPTKARGSPNAALFAFVLTSNGEPEAIGVDQLIVSERREQVERQRREFMRKMAADEGHRVGRGVGDRHGVVRRWRAGAWRPGDFGRQLPRLLAAAAYAATARCRASLDNGEPHQWRAEVR